MKEFADLFEHESFPKMSLKSFYTILEEVVMPNEPEHFQKIFAGDHEAWILNAKVSKEERQKQQILDSKI